MKPEVIKRFLLERDVVIFRYPHFSDWLDIMEKTNSLTKEKSFGSPQCIQTSKQHRRGMRERLKAICDKNAVYLVVEIRGLVVGTASIWKIPGEPNRGCLEISIRSTIPNTSKKLWGRGLGKKLIYAIIHEAKVILKIKTVKLGVYAVNHGAVHLYQKCGFKETHRIRREKIHYGIMRDRIYLEKYLR
jgi:RimJ/RimL family protein N-acetyltransferase